MGLRAKQVSGDQGLDWGQTLLHSGTVELSKPPLFTRRQPPPHQQSEPLNCPRCGSTNTKFCYYNNYNKSQPRHFCKSCKRHWTKGGTLRNVPVGGGRKNKRPRISNTETTTATTAAAAATTAPPHQGSSYFTYTNIGTDQTSMSDLLYKSLIRSSSSSSPLLHNPTDAVSMPRKPFLGSYGPANKTGLNALRPQNSDTEYPFSSLSSNFDVNTVNPTSCQSLNDHIDHNPGNLDSIEESSITALDIPTTSNAPWPGPDTTDLPNYWNWNEIDVLTSSAELNISWDDVDAEIKP